MGNFLENFLRFVEKNKSRVSKEDSYYWAATKYGVYSRFNRRSVVIREVHRISKYFYEVYLRDRHGKLDITDLITQEDAKTAYDALKDIVDSKKEADRKSFIDKFFQ